jgi:hypothetical protein
MKFKHVQKGLQVRFSALFKLLHCSNLLSSAEGASDNDDVINQLKKEVAELKAQVEQSKQSSMVRILFCLFVVFLT